MKPSGALSNQASCWVVQVQCETGIPSCRACSRALSAWRLSARAVSASFAVVRLGTQDAAASAAAARVVRVSFERSTA